MEEGAIISIFLITRLVNHPSNNMEGGAIISIFLITRLVTHPSNNMEGAPSSQSSSSPDDDQQGGTPALWSPAGVLFERGSGGSPVDPAKKTFAKHQGDNRVSRRSSGATEARRGSRGDFSLSLKSESDFNFVLIAVFLLFVSVLEEGL